MTLNIIITSFTVEVFQSSRRSTPRVQWYAYKSGSQRARVVTEFWGEHNLYCPNCSSPKLNRLTHNTKASDFSCPSCRFWYQLKGQKSRLGNSITDGAYHAMMNAIRNDETPNFYFMQYDLATWSVKNLLLIPDVRVSAVGHHQTESAGRDGAARGLGRLQHRLEPDSARSPDCRGHGEQGPRLKAVREKFKRVKPLKEISVAQRGWTLDVLNIVRRLGTLEFRLEMFMPANGNWKPCIPTTATSVTRFGSNCRYCGAAEHFSLRLSAVCGRWRGRRGKRGSGDDRDPSTSSG